MPQARWRALVGAVAGAVALGAAVTGCAARTQGHGGSQASNSPVATVTQATPTPTLTDAAAGDPVLVPAPAPSPPRCPPLVRFAAGNAGPLFCTDGLDDPAALRYFTGLHLEILQLPAGAQQGQAVEAICADLHHTSDVAEYSAYLLAANRAHWAFSAIADVHGALPRLCRPPSPGPSASPAPSHA